MNRTTKPLDSFHKNRELLLSGFREGLPIFDELGLKTQAVKIGNELQNLARESFKVVVAGEFKRGKSTLINALLGEKILPSYSRPCTAIITEVKWGEEKRLLLHPMPDQNSKDPQPVQVPVEDIKSYVCIPNDEDIKEIKPKYSKLELLWPLELCRNHVEIIDSPGLNENNTRDMITLNSIANADVVVFVFTAEQFGSSSEHETIETHLLAGNHKDSFFVVTHWDRILAKSDEEDPEILRRKIFRQLAGLTTRGESGIFLVSSKEALNAKIAGDEHLLVQTGIPAFEKSLYHFLAHDRARVKLLRPATILSEELQKVMANTIPELEKMLRSEVDVLQKKYDDVQPKLQNLERRRAQICEKFSEEVRGIDEWTRRAVRTFLLSAANEVPEVLEKHDPENKIQFWTFRSKKDQANALAQEYCSVFQKHFSLKAAQWADQDLKPELSDRIRKSCNDILPDIRNFALNLEGIRLELSSNDDCSEGLSGAGFIERTVASVAGFVLNLNPAAGFQGGFKGIAKDLIPHIAWAAIITSIFQAIGLLFDPTMWIALILGGFFRAFRGNSKQTDEIRKKVITELRHNTIENSDKIEDKLVEEITKQTNEIRKTLSSNLQAEIDSVTQTVQAALDAKKQAGFNAKKESERLDTLRQKAQVILGDITKIAESV